MTKAEHLLSLRTSLQEALKSLEAIEGGDPVYFDYLRQFIDLKTEIGEACDEVEQIGDLADEQDATA